jgi:hypothetical protein
MKTRTLLLLAVGTALAILLAGGVLLFQLSSESNKVPTVALGDEAHVGDVTITVFGAAPASADAAGALYGVDVELGGVDDPDGLDSIRLVTGDRSLAPLPSAADGRCTGITTAPVRCRLDFDTSGSETTSRVVVMRRGDDQANWRLPAG